jgi:murein DD-endopeptidase MepM/ murein hydrolase activator NlpD
LKKLFKNLIVSITIFSFLYAVFMVVILFKETKYVFPVSIVEIRNDIYGEGVFGSSRSNGRRTHKGVDLAGKVGTPIFAVKSGWAWTEIQPRGYGKVIKINHLDGTQSRYAHLNKFNISKWQWVWQGQEIGEMGKTGNANYVNMITHLHFEIRKPDKETCVDPMIYIG